MVLRLMGDVWKSWAIPLARSSTTTPTAPMVVVTAVTAKRPAIIQLSIRNLAAGTPSMSAITVSPRKRT